MLPGVMPYPIWVSVLLVLSGKQSFREMMPESSGHRAWCDEGSPEPLLSCLSLSLVFAVLEVGPARWGKGGGHVAMRRSSFLTPRADGILGCNHSGLKRSLDRRDSYSLEIYN